MGLIGWASGRDCSLMFRAGIALVGMSAEFFSFRQWQPRRRRVGMSCLWKAVCDLGLCFVLLLLHGVVEYTPYFFLPNGGCFS